MRMRALSAVIFSTLFLYPSQLWGGRDAAGQKCTSDYTIGPSVQPLIIIGEGWSQQFTFVNVEYYTPEPTVGVLSFYTKDGRPWKVPLKNYGSVDHVDINLQPGKMLVLETVVSYGPQVLGWAALDLTQNVDQWGTYHAYTVFRRQENGRPDLMTSVPFVDGLEDQWVVPFDNQDGKYPGIALVNTGNSTNRFILDITDVDGNVLKDIVKTIGPMSMTWFSLVGENPELANKRGQIRITGGYWNSAAFTLQFTPNGAFTGVPVVHTYGMP